MMSITNRSRVLAFVLAVAMVLSLVPVMAAAESGNDYMGYAKITYPTTSDMNYQISAIYYGADGKATSGQVAVKIAHEDFDGNIVNLLYYDIIDVKDGKVDLTVSLKGAEEGRYDVEFVTATIDDNMNDAYFFYNDNINAAESARDKDVKDADSFNSIALQQKLLTLSGYDVYSKYVVNDADEEISKEFYKKVEKAVFDLNPTYENDKDFVQAVEEATVVALFDTVVKADKAYLKKFIADQDILDVIEAANVNKKFNAKKKEFDEIEDKGDRNNTVNLIYTQLTKKDDIYGEFDTIAAIADYLYVALDNVIEEEEEGGVKETIKNDNNVYVPSAPSTPVNPVLHVSSVFTDLDANYWWVLNPLQELYSKGFVNGRTATTFAPGENITRAEFLKILLMELNMVDANATVAFSDVNANDWFYSYVASGANKGIVKGRTETEFAPNALITREEICIMTMRAVRACNIDLGTAVATGTFTDEANIASYAVEDVHALKAAGIVSGRDTGAFDSKANATRAEAVKILYGVYEKQ